MDVFYITAKGELYAAKTLTGMKLEFTRGKFGSGTPSGSISAMTDLVNPIGEMPISKKTTVGTTAIIQTLFSNYDDDRGALINPFYLNEMSLHARLLNADGTVNNDYPEIMFGYCYEQTQGQRISQLTEFVFNWPCTVSNANNVSVQISSEMWATREELEEVKDTVDELSNYSSTPQQIGVWMNEIPVWRRAYDITFSNLDKQHITEDGYISLGYFMNLVQSQDSAFILECNMQIKVGSIPDMVDDVYTLKDKEGSLSYYMPSGVSANDISGIYGYVIFATPEGNLSN